MKIIRVALPLPKRALFDYTLPDDQIVAVGCRVEVPFGRQTLIGFVCEIDVEASIAVEKLRPINQLIEQQSLFDTTLFGWLSWASQYYHHSLGEVLHAALPVTLRHGNGSHYQLPAQWQLTPAGCDFDISELANNAKRQQQALSALQQSVPITGIPSTVFNGLEKKGLVEKVSPPLPTVAEWSENINEKGTLTPSVEQALAISVITQTTDFQCCLLEGITGSGKTEVYLQAILPFLKTGKQVLILVPEIGLTPQTVSRFEKRFGVPVGTLHSGLTDEQRFAVWYQAKHGHIGIVIGTRSAIFTPFADLGMIILDEEHDSSFKQQDGFRYHARDLAVMRAKRQDIPLVLGTATPSLESLHNVQQQKFKHLTLSQRAGNANNATFKLLDIRHQPLKFGLCPEVIKQIGKELSAGNQAMVFINRRGFAPSLICHDCGHHETCRGCDAPLTVHLAQQRMQCHQCGTVHPLPRVCRQCNSSDIQYHGVGTEQIESGLQQLFQDYSCVRIDSDSMRGKHQLDTLLDDIKHHRHQLLVGTQILAKGHHFPDVTLVVIVNVDSALFSADFRAYEHLSQLIVQVAGRAGRANKPGSVWLQTHQPEHPLLTDLIYNGYQHVSRSILDERRAAALPPYYYQALFKAEHKDRNKCLELLRHIQQQLAFTGCKITGPLPCLIEKRQLRFRFMLVVHGASRQHLHQSLSRCIPAVEALPLANAVRWSVDVDPHDFS